MAVTPAEALRLLINSLPSGSEYLYDFNADIGKFLTAISLAQKTTQYDLVATLALEVNPATMVQRMPDWEAACGFAHSKIAQIGTIDQRRAQVLSKLREHGSFSFTDIQTTLEPFFGYADPTQIQIIEPDRAALTANHTYGTQTVNITLTTANITITVVDDNFITDYIPVQLFITASAGATSLSVTVSNPWGDIPIVQTLSPLNTGMNYILWGKTNRRISGNWVIQFVSSGPCTFTCGLFVEGLGRNALGADQAGGSMFVFSVVANEALLGPNFDLDAASLALARITYAHLRGSIFVKPAAGDCAYPDVVTTLPNITIPC